MCFLFGETIVLEMATREMCEMDYRDARQLCVWSLSDARIVVDGTVEAYGAGEYGSDWREQDGGVFGVVRGAVFAVCGGDLVDQKDSVDAKIHLISISRTEVGRCKKYNTLFLVCCKKYNMLGGHS